MKPNRFIPIFLFLLAGAAGIYLWACRQDAEPASEFTPSNMAATDRACPSGYCEFFVTVGQDADFTFCGDLYNATGSCDIGCTPATDEYIEMEIDANNSGRVCVADDGSVCIQNATLGAVDITVEFVGSTPISTVIPNGGKLCFHPESSCTVTATGCQ